MRPMQCDGVFFVPVKAEAIVNDLMREFLRAVGLADPDPNPHEHRCGLDIEERGREGCGYVWSHAPCDPLQPCTSEENEERHMCPRCGRGPWYTKRNERTESEAA